MRLSPANRKIKKLYKVRELKQYLSNEKKIYSFDLLAGHSCPSAKDCYSKAVEVDNKVKIRDGKDTKFRCYAASLEVIFPPVYKLHKENMEILRIAAEEGINKVCDALQSILPADAGIIRWHSSGDFKLKNYFLGFLKLVEANPEILFYCYTKQLKLWIAALDTVNRLPNLVMTASYGGMCDHLIAPYNLRNSKVVFSREEAKKLNLQIDYSDKLAANPKLKFKSFALLIHGIQPKGTSAADAWQKIKMENKYD